MVFSTKHAISIVKANERLLSFIIHRIINVATQRIRQQTLYHPKSQEENCINDEKKKNKIENVLTILPGRLL